ncbi:hypothetical protein [Streptomyces sp. NPDC058371]|uniref:hypothetical protein n=1 Tax=Streptomyces sp. NPDC058371 TaxID=3346463 RepID=UPI0036634E33
MTRALRRVPSSIGTLNSSGPFAAYFPCTQQQPALGASQPGGEQPGDDPLVEFGHEDSRQRSPSGRLKPSPSPTGTKSGTKIPSGIDRPAFEKWKKGYWQNRAKDFT